MKLSYHLFILSICFATELSLAAQSNDDNDEEYDEIQSISYEINSLQSGMEDASKVIELLNSEDDEEENKAKPRFFSMEQQYSYSLEQVDCKTAQLSIINQFMSKKTQLEICNINVTMHERLTEQSRIHVLEEQAEITELNRLITLCQNEQISIRAQIADEVSKLAACNTKNSASLAALTLSKSETIKTLEDQKVIISKISACRSATTTCHAKLAVCLNDCP